MRIAHLSDLHVTHGPRLDDQRACLDAIVDDVLACDPDLVLVTGDLFGHTVPYRSTPAERAVLYPALVRLAGAAPCLIIAGNHDDPIDLAALEHLGGADELGQATWPIRVLPVGHHEILTRAGTCHVYALPYPTARHYLAGERPEGGLAGIRAAVSARLGQLLELWGHAIRARRAIAPDEPHVLAYHGRVEGGRVSGQDSGERLADHEIALSRYVLDGMPVDYGAAGHLHFRQEVAHRVFYSGSPWRNDHGETDPKGWNLVTISQYGDDLHPSAKEDGTAMYDEDVGRSDLLVERIPSPCRDFVTLDYDYGILPGAAADATPMWIRYPALEQREAIAGAEVRMRLTVSEAHIAACPWSDEVARVERIAHRVKVEKRITPIERVRAPAIATAVDDASKMRAYFDTLADPVSDHDRAAAAEALAMIAREDDDAIARSITAIGVRS